MNTILLVSSTLFSVRFCCGWSGCGVKLTTYLHLVSKSRTCGAIPPPPRDNSTFTFFLPLCIVAIKVFWTYFVHGQAQLLPICSRNVPSHINSRKHSTEQNYTKRKQYSTWPLQTFYFCCHTKQHALSRRNFSGCHSIFSWPQKFLGDARFPFNLVLF